MKKFIVVMALSLLVLLIYLHMLSVEKSPKKTLSVSAATMPAMPTEAFGRAINFEAKASGPAEIDLRWQMDPMAKNGYAIYRNGILVKVVHDAHFEDNVLMPDTFYEYSVYLVLNSKQTPENLP